MLILYTSAALKLMSSVLLCWPLMSEVADVGVMAVEAKPSHQYSITFRCCATDGSRGAGRQESI